MQFLHARGNNQPFQSSLSTDADATDSQDDCELEDDEDGDDDEGQVDYDDAMDELTEAMRQGRNACEAYECEAGQHFHWKDLPAADIHRALGDSAEGVRVLEKVRKVQISLDDFMRGISYGLRLKREAEDWGARLAKGYAKTDSALLNGTSIGDDEVDDFISQASEEDAELWSLRMGHPILYGDICTETTRELVERRHQAKLRKRARAKAKRLQLQATESGTACLQ